VLLLVFVLVLENIHDFSVIYFAHMHEHGIIFPESVKQEGSLPRIWDIDTDHTGCTVVEDVEGGQ
jgi:hypothetical protein